MNHSDSHNQLKVLFEQYEILTKFAKDNSPKVLEALIDKNTRALFCESIGNARYNEIPLVIDNTFGVCGNISRPLDLGADIIVQLAPKWIGGHGTAIGAVTIHGGRFDWSKALPRFDMLGDLDACLAPQSAWLLIQGHSFTSRRKTATFNFGVSGGRGDIVVDNLKHHSFVVDIGEVHYLVIHPASTTEEERVAAGVTQDLLPVSVGTEHIGSSPNSGVVPILISQFQDDIIEDFELAFQKVDKIEERK
ncbi:hypothetical protein DXG01_015374 [Tephrocybe rancida]|nr:hypothetical protein DXG01_015374 [Tephrocybe rancida]